jgi:hypothetical protein
MHWTWFDENVIDKLSVDNPNSLKKLKQKYNIKINNDYYKSNEYMN